MAKLFTIAGLWILWGFSLGTLILFGPLRTAVDYARANNWHGWKENLIVFAFIALLAIVSFGISFFSSSVLNSRISKGKKNAIVIVPIITTVVSIAFFLNPDFINKKDQEIEISQGFTTGPYPTKEKIEELHAQGYTTIISLLHPAVVPFEPKLLAEEQANAKNVGIKVISIPLLPWVTDNEEAIKKLRETVKKAKGRYYIHCYLGRDRVNVAKLVILQESKYKIVDEQKQRPLSLDSIEAFERGNIYKLATNAYLTPMPTKEEYFGYIIAAGFKQVVTLKNLNDPGAKQSITEEQQWLAPYKIALRVFDIGNGISEPKMKLIVDSVKSIKGPKIIHAFRSDSDETILFMKIYGGK